MQKQNYYKLSDSLNGSTAPSSVLDSTQRNSLNSTKSAESIHKPYMFSFEAANVFFKTVLVLAMFASLFILGLNA
jgi:hypothetical protein